MSRSGRIGTASIWHCCSSASQRLSLDNHPVVFSRRGGGGGLQDALFPNRAHRASNTCIFRSCFSLIVSQPLICHSPDEYKLKHHSEVRRRSFSQHHLWLSEPRSRTGWSPDLSPKQPGSRSGARRGVTWWLPALMTDSQPIIREGRSACKSFRSRRTHSQEAGGVK